MTPGPTVEVEKVDTVDNIEKITITAENAAEMLKLARKVLQADMLLPSIIRGSRKHNEAVLKARAEALAVVTASKPSATEPSTMDPAATSEVKSLTSTSLDDLRKTLTAQAQNILNNHQSSPLYCCETLELSPQKPAAPKSKQLLLSPFSQAKQTAKRYGVGLSDECRGVYTDEELHSRIEFLASVTKKQRR